MLLVLLATTIVLLFLFALQQLHEYEVELPSAFEFLEPLSLIVLAACDGIRIASSRTLRTASTYLGLDSSLEYHCNPHQGYRVEIIHRDPLLLHLHAFLSHAEADHFIALAKPRMHESKVVGKESGRVANDARTSWSTFLRRRETAIVRCVEERAAAVARVPLSYMESLQVVWYRDGQEVEEQTACGSTLRM